MGSERSSSKAPLHNFTLPDGLRWGNQKFLRCMKVNANGQNSAIQRKDSRFGSSVTNNGYFDHGSNSVFGNDKNGFTRSENGDDFASYYSNYGSDKKKGGVGVAEEGVSLPNEKRLKVEEGGGGVDGDGINAVREKWNVRTRRGEYGVVSGGGSGGGAQNVNLGVIKNSGEALMVSPLRMVEGEATQRLRRVETSVKEMGVASPSGEKKERVKFSVNNWIRYFQEYRCQKSQLICTKFLKLNSDHTVWWSSDHLTKMDLLSRVLIFDVMFESVQHGSKIIHLNLVCFRIDVAVADYVDSFRFYVWIGVG
ncbi:hypothetical protein Leryth_003434 [Lithospermum erythrorhizon]|nr:hypothetical protein Leryth_003434 [Lithospermum erythrorhizon]